MKKDLSIQSKLLKKLLFVDYNISDLPTIIKKPKETHYKTSADNNR